MEVRKVRHAIVVAASILLPLLSVTPTAAGTNGQQIAFIDKLSYIYSICISGTNQNGYTYGFSSGHPCLPYSTPNQTTDVNGYWWEGTVAIDMYDVYGNFVSTLWSSVPANNGNPFENYECIDDSNTNSSTNHSDCYG